ncbi:MAG: NAD(P)-binding domain-containing protein, partial [Glaciecola sp.]|nr:NAD(P)-binding domain-containing protein [Glaciecola sp.]
MKELSDIGLVGLAVMGENLILNMASKGFTVTAYNRSYDKVERFLNGRAQGETIRGAKDIPELV